MTPAETHYSTFDRELLAVYLAIKHFRHFLEGRQFHMDHKPLTFALNKSSDHHSPWQAHQLDYISQFTSAMCHIHGLNNVVADTFSRIELNAILSGKPPTIDFAAMAESQATDQQIQALQSSPNSVLIVEAIPLANSTQPLYCHRPLVPLAWRRIVFDSLHDLSHPGMRATQQLITACFVWPGIVCCWARSCISCQRTKIQKHIMALLSSFPLPHAHFQVVHIDLVGPLPPSQGFTYLLTCIDRFTR